MVTVGTFVKSNYAASWTGLVTSIEVRKGSGKKAHKIATVLVILDRRGNSIKRKEVKTFDTSWLEVTKNPPLELIRLDWVENVKLRSELRSAL